MLSIAPRWHRFKRTTHSRTSATSEGRPGRGRTPRGRWGIMCGTVKRRGTIQEISEDVFFVLCFNLLYNLILSYFIYFLKDFVEELCPFQPKGSMIGCAHSLDLPSWKSFQILEPILRLSKMLRERSPPITAILHHFNRKKTFAGWDDIPMMYPLVIAIT